MSSTRDIQRRIKSISSTKKITKAMEMVAASKTRKAVEEVLRTRTYANLSWLTVLNLSSSGKDRKAISHPLLTKRTAVKKAAIVLIASNRGLCGAFNTAIMKKAHESVVRHPVESDFIILGKKGNGVYRYFGHNITAEFPKVDVIDQVSEVVPVAGMVIKDFLDGKYDKILVAYTDYVSATIQMPRVKQLLPVDIATQDEFLGIVGQDERLGVSRDFIESKKQKYLHDKQYHYEYIFEPSPEEVLDEMVPRLIEVQLYQAVLESNASEQSARMAAMHQATEAAEDMVAELTLSYNKARQAGITNEIAEISAGANALKG